MPPAYNDGAQVALLRRQLEAMEDGGTVVISSPVNPARCPPAPYERASLIAHYLKTKKPNSKVIVLDAKESFTMQKLFEAAWQELYPGMIEWVGLSNGGALTSVDAATKTLVDRLRQIQGRGRQRHPAAEGRARRRARRRRRPHRLVPGRSGDVRSPSSSPTSMSSATPPSPARCRARPRPRIRRARSAPPPSPRCWPARRRRAPTLTSSCYSLIAPDYAISQNGTYRPVDDQYAEAEGGPVISPQDAPRARRARPRPSEAERLVPHHHRRGVRMMRRAAPVARCVLLRAGAARRRRCAPTRSSATPSRNR